MAIDDRPAPIPADGEVLARVVASGICGSELEAYAGRSSKRRPGLVFGHEFVVAVGDERFVVDPLTSCESCTLCLTGRTNLCADRQLLSLHRDGGNRELVALDPSRLLPWEGDATIGTLVEPAATVLRALGGSLPGDGLAGARVGIFGCGALGLLGVLLARRLGAATVFAFDPLPSRLGLAEAAGATRFDPDGAPLACDLVLDTVGAAGSRSAAIRHTMSGGDVALIGFSDASSALDFSDVIARGIRLTGAYAYTRDDLRRAAELIATEPFADRLITRMPFSSGPEAFAEALNSPDSHVKIVLEMER
jgi:alcohol dehydrogenase